MHCGLDELAPVETDVRDYRRGGLVLKVLTQVNHLHQIHTIARVAAMFGEDEDWLQDVATEMGPEDGLILVYGPDDQSVSCKRSKTINGRIPV